MIVQAADLEGFVNETFSESGKGIEAILVASLVRNLDEVVEGIGLLRRNTGAQGVETADVDVRAFSASWVLLR